MYDFGRPYGESCYRLMSRTGQFIYLKTRGCLEVDDKTRQVHSFVCVNSLVSDDEGRRLIREMKKKFSAIISEAELSAMESDVPAVENPQKLERAILNLITNLNTASYDDDNVSMISDSTTENDDNRRIKSPPLAIIPPKPHTIKHSIFKGVGVIGQASKGKSPSIKEEPKSPEVPHQTPNTSGSPTRPHVKTETTCNILSPNSSSMSSVESDMSSPFLLSNQHNAISLVGASNELVYIDSQQTTTNCSSTNSTKLDEFFTPFDSLPVYGNDTSSNSLTTIGDETILTSAVNNNSSCVNRNSVLKRACNSDVDDYTELIKKRAISVHSPGPGQPAVNPPLDLLATSGSGNVVQATLQQTKVTQSLINRYVRGVIGNVSGSEFS